MSAELTRLKALVVDDDFNTCDSVTKMLAQIGMRSEWTLSGREAVPIVAMTANAFDEDRKAAANCGMNGFISKPINMEEVIGALHSVLGKKRSTDKGEFQWIG